MKQTRNFQFKRRRENLIKKDPHCYWCKGEVVYFPLARFVKMPDNFATIDHLHTRFTPEVKRASVKGLETTVLACHKCNQERSNNEQSSRTKEELWARAKAYPTGHPLNKDLKETNWAKHKENML